ncbi:MAG: cytochrome c maturation protein CcmE [Actinomycetota bacterium]
MTDRSTDPSTESPDVDPFDEFDLPDDGAWPGPSLDLTPSEHLDRPRRRWRNWVIMGVLALAAGFVLVQALTNARVFFLNVDEAVAQRAELEGETFRMQGTVVDEPRTAADGSLLFTVAFGGAEAQIRHVGDEPSNLFELGEAVVAEGRWDGEVFLSSQILVKHSEEYVEDNPDRVDYELEYELDGGLDGRGDAAVEDAG